MVPANYLTFFTSMAAVGATLFGLIFVAISIAPENFANERAQSERQIRATAAYVALLNPLIVSLFALVPYQWLGIAAMSMGGIGIINTLAMSATLFKSSETEYSRVRNVGLIVISLVLYSGETYVASHLDQQVVDVRWLSLLADLLIVITIFGIVRAWELIGIRRFRLRDWFINLWVSRKERKNRPTGDAGKEQSD